MAEFDPAALDMVLGAPTDGNGPELVCYAPTATTTNGIWLTSMPLDYSFPLFLLQIILILFTTRAAAFLLRPLRQPRYISDIIVGFLLGRSVAGKIPNFHTIFPQRSVLVLEAISQMGLIYFMFTVGITIEVTVVKRAGVRCLAFAAACMVTPFAIGALAALGLHPRLKEGVNSGAYIIFLGLTLSVSAFSVLARILAELKLLSSDIGRQALAAAMCVNACSWALLILAISLANSDGNVLASLWAVLSGIALFGVTFLVVKPAMHWVMRRTPEGEEVDELYVCVILVGVLVWALVADVLGTSAIFGAFTLGLVIPNGPLGEALIDKVEDFVAGIFMPIYYAQCGLRNRVDLIEDSAGVLFLIFIALAAAVAKLAGSMLVAFLYQMPLKDGFSIGLLMNTKGVIELIILNIGLDKNAIGTYTYTVLVLMSAAVTAMVSPLLTAVVKPARHIISYKRRTIQWSKPESEFRLLVCVHATRHVPAMISLLDISNPTKRSPIFVYALHLVELTGRATSMLVFSDNALAGHHMKDASNAGTNLGRIQTQSEHIMQSFESYEQHAGGVSVQPLTAFSPFSTMHEDVCSLAEDKRAALIVLPFHKHQTVDGSMEVTHPSMRTLNQNVLANAPCSVAIIIDRGLGSGAAALPPGARRTLLLFFGGPDDREALAYACRLVGHPAVDLTVLRVVQKAPVPCAPKNDEKILNVMFDDDREQRADEESISDFRRRIPGTEGVQYVEKMASDAEETLAVIRSVEPDYQLCIVGKGQDAGSPLTAGLTDWSECPELGVIGDLLASSDFVAKASVMVVQRCRTGPPEVLAMPDSPGRHVKLYLNNNKVAPMGTRV